MSVSGLRGNGLSLKLDVNQNYVSQRSVYEYIQDDLSPNNYTTDRVRHVKKSLIGKFTENKKAKLNFSPIILGKTVLTRYNNKSYVIHDVDFDSSPVDRFQDDDQMLSFAVFYKKRYNIDTRYGEQPMLINRVAYEEPKSGSVASYVHCLIPEFCYPVHTEW